MRREEDLQLVTDPSRKAIGLHHSAEGAQLLALPMKKDAPGAKVQEEHERYLNGILLIHARLMKCSPGVRALQELEAIEPPLHIAGLDLEARVQEERGRHPGMTFLTKTKRLQEAEAQEGKRKRRQ